MNTIKVKDILAKLQDMDPETEVLTLGYDSGKDRYYYDIMAMDDFSLETVQRFEHDNGEICYSDAIDVDAVNQCILDQRVDNYNRIRKLRDENGIYVPGELTPLYKMLRQPNKTVLIVRGG